MYQFQFFVTKHDTTALLLFTSVHHLFSKVKDLGTSIAYCCCIYYPRSLHSLSLANSMAKQVLGRWSLPTMTGRFWMVKIAKSITWKNKNTYLEVGDSQSSGGSTWLKHLMITWKQKTMKKTHTLATWTLIFIHFFLVLSMVDLLVDL